MREYILCAANYYNDGIVYVHVPKNINVGFCTYGHRHHNCIMIFSQIVGFPYSEESLKLQNTEVQGFLTNTNRFIDRVEALEIAKKENQIKDLGQVRGNKLFSEDLY